MARQFTGQALPAMTRRMWHKLGICWGGYRAAAPLQPMPAT
jgi:hypothetical protein